jgi:hypothetical protein
MPDLAWEERVPKGALAHLFFQGLLGPRSEGESAPAHRRRFAVVRVSLLEVCPWGSVFLRGDMDVWSKGWIWSIASLMLSRYL